MNTRDEQITNTVPVEPYLGPLQPLPRAPLVRYATPSLPSIEDADVPQHNALVTTYRVSKRVLGKWLWLGFFLLLTSGSLFLADQWIMRHSWCEGRPFLTQLYTRAIWSGPLTLALLFSLVVAAINLIREVQLMRNDGVYSELIWRKVGKYLLWIIPFLILAIYLSTVEERYSDVNNDIYGQPPCHP